LAKEFFSLKREVAELKVEMQKYGKESEDSYKIDSWARQEIIALKE